MIDKMRALTNGESANVNVSEHEYKAGHNKQNRSRILIGRGVRQKHSTSISITF